MRFIVSVARSLPARSKLLNVRVLALVMLVGLAACDLMGPAEPLPDRAVAFVAPPQYQTWWAQTEACSGRQGHLERIAWYVVPDVTEFTTPEGENVGRWSRGSNGTQIVVAGAYLVNELVVRHEMLHALLNRPDHLREYFVDRCHLTWESWGG